jgi:release factor glutamine methyltransferase
MNIRQFQQELKNQLSSFLDEGEAFAVSREVLFHLTGFWPPYSEAEIVTEEIKKEADAMLQRLRASEPLQYITGKALFRDLELKVSPAVLIPRPETAEMVDLILSESGFDDGNIVDLGTGSGCLALALKWEFPNAVVKAMDVSLDALHLARENSLLNKLNVDFLWMDMGDDEFLSIENSFDLVVSNPPYIAVAEMHTMEKHVLNHEPHMALFAPDDDPLFFYRRIAAFSTNHLNPNGSIWLELNPIYADEISDIFRRVGMSDVRIYQDISGKDRFLAAFR